MSSKITKLVKEAEAMMTADEGEHNPQIAMLIRLVVETLRTVSAASKKATKSAKKGAESAGSDGEKSVAPKRKPSAWASWVKDVKIAHPEEYEAFKGAHPEMKSHVISFAKEWKDTHTDEYNIYVAARDLASDTESTGEKPAKPVKAKKEKAEKAEKPSKPKKAPAPKKAAGGAGKAKADSDSDSSDSDSD
jgi:hypothetical protein